MNLFKVSIQLICFFRSVILTLCEAMQMPKALLRAQQKQSMHAVCIAVFGL